LAEAIVDIVENKDKFNRETIRHRAEEFSTEKFEERILQVFREVLGMENG
jgi:glycosyltransferase involved in cell wall biosynthesis